MTELKQRIDNLRGRAKALPGSDSGRVRALYELSTAESALREVARRLDAAESALEGR